MLTTLPKSNYNETMEKLINKHELVLALWKAAKEPLRLLVLAILPVLTAYLGDLSYWWAGVAIILLRLLDSILHEVGKETNNKTLIKGLTRF
jgi:hypothetical protein